MVLDVLEFIFNFICVILTLLVDVWVILIVVSFFMIMVGESFLVGLIMLILFGFPLSYIIYRFNQMVYNSIF